jgi:tRNA A-37 threonylcarbamoyl transferase component Bud32
VSFAQPFSNYEILARVGSGAMGTVFKARQKHMNRIVALKVLKPALARDERFVERLRREARIVGKLNHPNIVTGYDLGEEGGYHFFVMEYVEGRSLRQLLHEWGMFPEEQVLDVAIQIAGALAHAYDCGVIHRDVKPGNILIDQDGRVKLTDMGLAKVETDLQLTREGATVGTPQYVSPEQARDPRSADARSDLYSLGATLFHMSTGQTPFHADTIGELITKVLHDRPPTAISVNPALSDGLSLVIRKLLSKDPDLRYQTPGELLVDLQRLQRHEKPAIDRSELEVPPAVDGAAHLSGGRHASIPRRVRAAWVIGVAAAVVVVGAAAYSLWSAGEDRGTPPTAAATARFEADWRGATSFRERAEVIAAGRTRGVDERVLARTLDELETDMRRAVDAALESWRGARRSEAMSWLGAPGQFADSGGFIDRCVVPDLTQQLGFAPDGLPSGGLRRDAANSLAELRAVVDDWCVALVAGLVRRAERHLRGPVRDGALALARLRDFGGARGVIAQGLDEFLGTEGRPTREQLEGTARGQIEGIESDVQELLLAEVEDARQAGRRQALASLDEGLATLGRVREQEASVAARLAGLGLVVARLRTEVQGAERELGPFDAELGEAWAAARARLAAAGLEVEALRSGVREAAAAEVLAFAYRCLLEAGPATATAALSAAPAPAEVGGSFALHRDALESAASCARSLAESVRARGDDGYPRPTADGGWADATGRALSFGAVDWAGLLTAPGLRPAAGDPLGRALLLLTSGRHAEAVHGLSPELRRFVEAELWPQIRAARDAERSAAVRTVDSALALAVERRAAGDTAGLRAALDELDARSQDGASVATAALRAELRLWLQRQEQRDALLASARKRLPDGFGLELTESGLVRASGALSGLVEAGRAALRVVGDTVTSSGPGSALGIPIPVAQPGSVRVELEVRFPREDQLALGLALHVGGVNAALAVLPEGQVAAVLAQGPAAVLDEDEGLRRALSGPLSAALDAAPEVTHGAWHRLQIDWIRRRGDGVDVQLGWVGADGPRLAAGRFTGRDPDGVIWLRALGPVELREVVIEAAPDGG